MDGNKKPLLTEKQEAFIVAFEKNATNVSEACKKSGINRATFYRWLETNATLKETVDEIREGLIDFAESMLYKNMQDGKESSILFFLKTRGRDRGYIEKRELDMTITEIRPLDDFYK